MDGSSSLSMDTGCGSGNDNCEPRESSDSALIGSWQLKNEQWVFN